MVAMARNTPRRRNTGNPSGNATAAGKAAAAIRATGKGSPALTVKSAAAYAPSAMNPALPRASWPHDRVV